MVYNPAFGVHSTPLGSVSGLTFMQSLISQGFTPVAAAGITGNAIYESGGSGLNVVLNPPTGGNTGDAAVGALQWEGSRGLGFDPSLDSTVSHIYDEFSAGNQGLTLDQVNAYSTPGAAASGINYSFERPQYPAASDAQRQSLANQIYAQYNAQPSVAPDTSIYPAGQSAADTSSDVSQDYNSQGQLVGFGSSSGGTAQEPGFSNPNQSYSLPTDATGGGPSFGPNSNLSVDQQAALLAGGGGDTLTSGGNGLSFSDPNQAYSLPGALGEAGGAGDGLQTFSSGGGSMSFVPSGGSNPLTGALGNISGLGGGSASGFTSALGLGGANMPAGTNASSLYSQMASALGASSTSVPSMAAGGGMPVNVTDISNAASSGFSTLASTEKSDTQAITKNAQANTQATNQSQTNIAGAETSTWTDIFVRFAIFGGGAILLWFALEGSMGGSKEKSPKLIPIPL